MVFLEFEKPLESLYEQLEKIQQVGSEGDLDVTNMVSELEQKIKNKRKELNGKNINCQIKLNETDLLDSQSILIIFSIFDLTKR